MLDGQSVADDILAASCWLARAKEAFHEANRRIRSYQLIVPTPFESPRVRGGAVAGRIES